MSLEEKINNYLDFRPHPDTKNSYIYSKDQKKYSMLFIRDSSDGLVVHYYRVQVLFNAQTYDLMLQRDSGTFEAPNNFKELKSLGEKCISMFDIEVSLEKVNLKFACLEERYCKHKQRLPVRFLLKIIFDLDIIEKVLEFYDVDSSNSLLLGVPQGAILSVATKSNLIKTSLQKSVYNRLVDRKTNQVVSMIEIFYQQLKTKIDVLDKNTERFELIRSCIQNTHSVYHSHYEIEVRDVFVVKRFADREKFKRDLGNKKLLWHGTRSSNIASILKNGFELNPPVAGKSATPMFGTGIYFTNVVSKAANYCDAGDQTRVQRGVLLLCEVALGNMMVCNRGQNYLKLPQGKDSVYAKGQLAPHKNYKQKILYNVEFAYGPLVEVPLRKRTSLKHDEYVVFDPTQVKIRYLVLMCLEIKAINDYLDCYQDESLKFSTIYVDKKTGKKYTRTFFKNLSDGKKFYYRVQLLSKKNNEFVLQRDSGTLNVPNNFKELKQNLPFHTCVKIFNISVFRKNVDLKFFCLEKRDDRYKKRLPVRHLLRNILDMTIVKKVLQLYNIDKIKMNSLQGINDSSVEAKFQIIDSLLKKNTYCQLVSCKNNQAISLLDVFYKKLNTKIDVLDKSTERWEDRKGFLGKLGNKKLLWHGTRISNVASILEKGFELDPNIAHKAFSLMFGKGIYFTNTVSKAANYCGTGTASRNKIGVLFLAEVALGKMKVTLEALPNLTQLPEGHHSVFAKGLLTPHRNFKQKVLYNVELAYGELLQIPSRNSQLKHDEFVVYDPKQIKIRTVKMSTDVSDIEKYLSSYQDNDLKFATLYENPKTQCKYTQTFIKNSSERKKFYYRVQILCKKNTNEFFLEKDFGTLEVPNNVKEVNNLPLDVCMKVYKVYLLKSNVDLKFSCLEAKDEMYKKRLPVRHLLRTIMDLKMMKKVLRSYYIDKKKLNGFSLSHMGDMMSVDTRFQIIESFWKQKISCQLIDRETNQAISLLDVFYKQLHTKIDILDKNTERWKLIETCVKNTHSTHHSEYTIKVNEIFVLKRWEDSKRFKDNLGNKKLLWHGTRMDYVASILERGFEIEPNNVLQTTIPMFGKGIYFTNAVSKAANYCSKGSNTRCEQGVLFLCEVALGNMEITFNALPKFVDLPEGVHSVFGKGLMSPQKNIQETVLYNVQLAYGKLLEIPGIKSQLIHDEYVVYDPRQVKMRYLVFIDFEDKE
ncbi:hypothetical protein KQX54_009393 [Cotesia glomerata]|uniref:Poly [ADP-ribose] polymerase n=2 Tax=Cotesia glomerata TaxID=32391 RepID=A0AAV7HT84_COTGL|nr:hypothetical protein KQX54_009393 [Cotesia glomerata]